MRTGKQKTNSSVKNTFCVICSSNYCFYQFRDAVLQQTIAKVSNTMEINYNSPDDTIYKAQRIIISGPARSFPKIKTQDTTQVKIDSLSVDKTFYLYFSL
jgi:hypothetical protein